MNNRSEIHDKIQQIAAKIIDLNAGFADSGKLSTLDKDLLKKYIHDLYETILTLEPGNVVTETKKPVKEEIPVPQPPVAPPAAQPPVTETPKAETPVPTPPLVKEPEPPAAMVEQPVILADPIPAGEVVAPRSEMPTVENTMPPVAQELINPIPPKQVERPSLYEKHLQTDKNDLASKLQQSPIHDLKKAISINKKFEFINELFKGDHEKYAKAIHYMNGLTSGAVAKEHLNQLKREYNWNEEDRLYIELANLVDRRFM